MTEKRSLAGRVRNINSHAAITDITVLYLGNLEHEMIQLVEGFWVDPHAVTVIKANGKDKCSLWVTGQAHLTDSCWNTQPTKWPRK
jgi:hypothetical protein